MSDILQSKEALSMIHMVTQGFYDNSRIGQWIFESLGREWDEMSGWSTELHQEIFLNTCTWGVDIWEELYDIIPDASLDLEVRRQRLLAKALHRAPVNPESIRVAVCALTGCDDVVIEEHVAPYTFSVTVFHSEDMPNMGEVWTYIYEVKPSHLSFRLFFVRETCVDALLHSEGLTTRCTEVTLEEVIAHREISSILGTSSVSIGMEDRMLEEVLPSFLMKSLEVSVAGLTQKVEETLLDEVETTFVCKETVMKVGGLTQKVEETLLDEVETAFVCEETMMQVAGLAQKVEETLLDEVETAFVCEETVMQVGGLAQKVEETLLDEVETAFVCEETVMQVGGLTQMVEETLLDEVETAFVCEEMMMQVGGLTQKVEETLLDEVETTFVCEEMMMQVGGLTQKVEETLLDEAPKKCTIVDKVVRTESNTSVVVEHKSMSNDDEGNIE